MIWLEFIGTSFQFRPKLNFEFVYSRTNVAPMRGEVKNGPTLTFVALWWLLWQRPLRCGLVRQQTDLIYCFPNLHIAPFIFWEIGKKFKFHSFASAICKWNPVTYCNPQFQFNLIIIKFYWFYFKFYLDLDVASWPKMTSGTHAIPREWLVPSAT